MAQADVIIGLDAGLRGVMERVGSVAKSSAPVLLYGETGTGKEVIARAIHQTSRRRQGPFWRVNCGAVPRELVDSELFGHERGAFTGATTQRKGWFEQADGGTLFLDEVGELPLDAQVRLLRVVQDGELLRVGGERPIRVDVRLVAATHRDLPAMVESRAFREDLFYRLAVFPIVLPPLRDRPGDIGPLAAHFAARAAQRFGLRPAELNAADIALLLDYGWPGNVRELAAVIDRAVLLGDGEGLAVAPALGQNPAPSRGRATDSAPVSSARVPADERLDSVIRAHIETVLVACHGRVEGPFGAAKRLAVNPRTLRSRMRKLGIDGRRFRQT